MGFDIQRKYCAVKKGWPILGVVYEAGMDECFTAYEGGGAYLNGTRISTTTSERLEDTLLATGFPITTFQSCRASKTRWHTCISIQEEYDALEQLQWT